MRGGCALPCADAQEALVAARLEPRGVEDLDLEADLLRDLGRALASTSGVTTAPGSLMRSRAG